MNQHLSSPRKPKRPINALRYGLILAPAALIALTVAAPKQSHASAKKTATSSEKKKVPWYNKKVQIPKTGNTQVSVRLASFYQYFHENYDNKAGNDQYSAFVNRLTVKSASRFKKGRSFSVTARIDTQNMWENNIKNRKGRLCGIGQGPNVSSASLAECEFGNDYRLERLAFNYSTRKLNLTVGDFNVNLGRAMGLSVRRLDQIGMDAAIKGIKFRYKTRRVDTTLIGGHANRQNSDFAIRRRVRDPGYLSHLCKNKGWNKADRYGNSLWSICSDLVVGGRVDIKKLPGRTKLGLHHATIMFGGYGMDAPDKDGKSAGGKRIHLTGMDLTPGRIGGVWDTFVGGALALARYPGGATPDTQKYNGVAFYTSNNLSLGDWNVLVEGKYYNKYLIAYNIDSLNLQYAELATLERFDQWIPGAATTAGGRVRVDYFVPNTGWDIYVNSMAYAFSQSIFGETSNMFSEKGGVLALHTFGGFEYHKHHSPFTLNLAVGYRSETKNKRDETTGKRINKRSLPHFDLFAKIPLSSKGRFQHTLQITSSNWYETKGPREGAKERDELFYRGNLIVEYSMAPFMTVSFVGGYTTQNRSAPGSLVLDKSRVCTKEESKQTGGCQPQLYPGVAARFNFLGRSYLQLFAGKRLGGLVCVNGSCRTLPDFVGADAQLVLSF